MSAVHRALFWGLARVGRPFGGIRPRRITHWLGIKGFANFDPSAYAWHRNRWGMEMRLNPFYFLDRTIIAFGSYEDELHTLIDKRIRPGMVCFDCGANIGEMTLHLGRCVAPGGKVYAFEPTPLVRARLEAHVARNGLQDVVSVQPVALSDRDGTTEMSFAPEAVQNQGEGSVFADHERPFLSESCQVPLVTIDAFVEKHGVTRIDFMKVDIQGSEPRLLAGGRRVFGEMSPDIVMEISQVDLKAAGTTGAGLVSQLEAYGYGVYELGESASIGRRIRPDDVGDHTSIGNVYCTKTAP